MGHGKSSLSKADDIKTLGTISENKPERVGGLAVLRYTGKRFVHMQVIYDETFSQNQKF